MTHVLETRIASFNFINEFDTIPGEYCQINVKVEKKKYQDGKLYYYVDYTYQYSVENKRCQQANPLIPLTKEKEEIYNGDIIAVNDLTDQLINYLLMPFDQLKKYTGNSTPQHYKTKIIETIQLLWD